MSHAIYYTSAPQGLRPGQRGFCTVATTDGIARPLWDRLESVSGYRHEFAAGSGSRNPVSWAHQLLSVQGREVSVLSRVCDSGLDYTQRTNAFAHHIALELSERASGGPAWMLGRPGVMATQWDGQVGAISRPVVPAGDVRPAVCSAWRRLAGDAGWGGVLAEAGMKHPRRSACILYAPDQDIFPLIAEAIALLPPARRWDITFNTYFTGLPGNAVCAWRCCLAGTPAAADAVRHAGAGLVIDLTRAGGPGTAPAGPWVEAARTGRTAAGIAETAGPARPRTATPRSRSAIPAEADPTSVEPIEVAPADVDPVDFDPGDFAPEEGPGPGDLYSPPQTPNDTFGDLRPPARRAEPAGTARSMDRTWVDQQQRSRRWLLLGVSVVALLFIGAGVWLRTSADRATAERPLDRSTPDPEPQLTPEPATIEPVLPPVARTLPTTTVATAPSLPDPPEPVQQVVPPKPLPPPATIRLPAGVLPPVTTGAALKAPTQGITIPSTEFDNLPAVASFKLLFPGRTGTYTYRQKDLSGVLTAEASGGFRYNLLWRDDANKAVVVDVASVSLETTASSATLEIGWRMKALLNRPELVSLVRVLLHNTDLVVSDSANRRPQSLRFKPPDVIDVSLTAPTTPLNLSPLPEADCRPVGSLPAGWTVGWTPGPTTRAADGETEVGSLLFARVNPAGGEPARFHLRFGPRWSVVSSNFAQQLLAARQAVMQADAALARANEEVTRTKEALERALEPIRKDIAEAREQLKLTDTELASRFTNKQSLRMRIKNGETRLDETKKAWSDDMEQASRQREPAESARAIALETVAGFEQWSQVEMIVELPGKLPVATLRLKRP